MIIKKWIRSYVRTVDKMNRLVGRFVMYTIFLLIGILFYSLVSKAVLLPSLWTLEMAQFVMTSYYILGGAYSFQMGGHVRMDLLYGHWSVKKKAWVDVCSIFFLIFYLSILLYGGISSTSYAIFYQEKSYSAWQPYLAPIKIIMCFGILCMLLQAIAEFFKDVAKIKGFDL